MSKRTVLIQILLELIFSFSFIIHPVLTSPTSNNLLNKNEIQTLPVPPAELFQFLRRFGYLESAPGDSEALYSEEAVIDAVKVMQRFGGIKETGELNDETLQLLITPRCGREDVSSSESRVKRFVIGGPGWRKRKVTYFIANWSPKIGTEEKIASDIRRAFDVWAHYSNLKFIRVNRHAQADIIISFGAKFHGDSYPFDGPGNILAHAFYPYEDPSYGGDVHFDNDENWVEGAQTLRDGVDFLSVAIHELGHSLGLAHSYDPEAVMFPYYRGGTSGHALQYDDILGMYELYVKNPVTATDDDDLHQPTYINEIDKTTESQTPSPRKSSRRRMKTTTTTSTTEMPGVEAVTDNIMFSTTTESSLTTDKPLFTFEGDYETIEKHKERFTVTPTSVHDFSEDMNENNDLNIPNICEGQFDAASVIRGEVFIFKGAYVWRLGQKLKLVEGYPTLWKEVFPIFPESVKKIDAVYEREIDSSIVFFTGTVYWVFDGQQLIENSPQSITNYGISRNITNIDAVMIWAKNNKTYLFAQDNFWRFNENTKRLDYGYPMKMDRWYGIPSDIDAALTLPNGKTYFFKNNKYWLFNNKWVRPEKNYPRKASKVWLGCK